MTETQLKALVGCVLKFKSYDFVILEVKSNAVIYNPNKTEIELDVFISSYIPKMKIYLTEDEESLVPIEQYLKHYDIK